MMAVDDYLDDDDDDRSLYSAFEADSRTSFATICTPSGCYLSIVSSRPSSFCPNVNYFLGFAPQFDRLGRSLAALE